MGRVELWKAVALSLDVEPASLWETGFRPEDDDPLSMLEPISKPMPKIFLDRLSIAESHVGKDLQAVELVKKGRCMYFSTVLLADFAAWAEGLPWEIPTDFPRSGKKKAKAQD